MPTRKATPQRKPHHREDETFHAAEKSYAAAMTFFTRQNWPKAQEAFHAFLKDHGDNREFPDMVDRARTHLKACDQRLAPPPPDPTTADEWLIEGVSRANCGDIEPALVALDRALAGGAPPARVHYARAAALALVDRNDEALADLAKALEADPSTRFHSLADPDFEQLRETAGYVALIEPPQSYDADDLEDDDIDDEEVNDDLDETPGDEPPEPHLD
jgi:tetratricopeptide (TPR) repeat protein